MPTFRIRISNHEFAASDESQLPTQEAARREAVRAALDIGAEEVCGGKTFFGAEVAIERDGETIERLLVALGASTLR